MFAYPDVAAADGRGRGRGSAALCVSLCVLPRVIGELGENKRPWIIPKGRARAIRHPLSMGVDASLHHSMGLAAPARSLLLSFDGAARLAETEVKG